VPRTCRKRSSTIPSLETIVVRGEQLGLPADIERYVEAARMAQLARKGAGTLATLRAYHADWGVFTRWCRERGRQPLPAEPQEDALLRLAPRDRASSDQPSVIEHVEELSAEDPPVGDILGRGGGRWFRRKALHAIRDPSSVPAW
jgi:hypothetical protein